MSSSHPETSPTPNKAIAPNMTAAEKVEAITGKMRDVLEILGLDLNDPSLQETPHRIAKMYVNEIFSGLNPDTFPEVTFFPNDGARASDNSIVHVKSGFTSFCEHHFVPMVGVAHVAYIPKDKLIGLSKVPRVLQHFARRPQLQERLTREVADCLCDLLDSDDVAVWITARHYCVLARGVEDACNATTTQVLRGSFTTDANLRREFLGRALADADSM